MISDVCYKFCYMPLQLMSVMSVMSMQQVGFTTSSAVGFNTSSAVSDVRCLLQQAGLTTGSTARPLEGTGIRHGGACGHDHPYVDLLINYIVNQSVNIYIYIVYRYVSMHH